MTPYDTVFTNQPHSNQNELLTGKTIFVIDDDGLTLQTFEVMLARSPANIKLFDRAKDALVEMRHQLPDVILLDVVMPEMDGWSFYDSIRQVTDSKDIPVIMLSCLFDEVNENMLNKRSENCWFIGKPVRPVHLMNIICEALENR